MCVLDFSGSLGRQGRKHWAFHTVFASQVFTWLVSSAISTVDLLVIVKVMIQAWQTFGRDVFSCFQRAEMLAMEHDKHSANWFLQNVNVDLIQLCFWPGLS